MLRLLIVTWLVTRGGAGDMSTWHCMNMLSCTPEDEAEDNKAVVAMAAAILAGDGPEPARPWFKKLCPPPRWPAQGAPGEDPHEEARGEEHRDEGGVGLGR